MQLHLTFGPKDAILASTFKQYVLIAFTVPLGSAAPASSAKVTSIQTHAGFFQASGFDVPHMVHSSPPPFPPSPPPPSPRLCLRSTRAPPCKAAQSRTRPPARLML